MSDPRFFESPAALRAWLRRNHKTAPELHVGFFKRHTGTAGLTWPQSVAEALCFGWIDGVRWRLDDDRYIIRFTPRRKGSRWSAVNIRMAGELERAGRMTEAGRVAFGARVPARSRVYSYEQKEAPSAQLDGASVREFRKHKEAWAFFEAQPPGYRRKASWWVMSAKQDQTRDRRLAQLVKASGAEKRLG